MAGDKSGKKGGGARKIGQKRKRTTNANYISRFNRCVDAKAKRILTTVLYGNPRTKDKKVPKLIDQQNGTFKITGYPGYVFVKHNRSITRSK
jgi:hypothetical protein